MESHLLRVVLVDCIILTMPDDDENKQKLGNSYSKRIQKCPVSHPIGKDIPVKDIVRAWMWTVFPKDDNPYNISDEDLKNQST